MMHKIKQIKV